MNYTEAMDRSPTDLSGTLPLHLFGHSTNTLGVTAGHVITFPSDQCFALDGLQQKGLQGIKQLKTSNAAIPTIHKLPSAGSV